MSKRIYDLLRELDPEVIIENDVTSYLKEVTLNPRIIREFGDKTLKEYVDFLYSESRNQLEYLLKIPLKDKESGEEDYYIFLEFNNWADWPIHYYVLPEHDINNPNADHYSMEGFDFSSIMGMYVNDTDEENLYKIISFVFYETYYFWEGSKIRPIMKSK